MTIPSSIDEEEILRRAKGGKRSQQSVRSLIKEIKSIGRLPPLDEDKLGRILKKTKRERVLRVKQFKLTQAEFDALQGYFEDTEDAGSTNGSMTGDELIRRMLDEFIENIS